MILHFEAFKLGTTPVYIAFLRFMRDNEEPKKKIIATASRSEANGQKLTWQGVRRSIQENPQDQAPLLAAKPGMINCRKCFKYLKLHLSVTVAVGTGMQMWLK